MTGEKHIVKSAMLTKQTWQFFFILGMKTLSEKLSGKLVGKTTKTNHVNLLKKAHESPKKFY